MVQNLLWVGATARMTDQPKGMPRTGTVTEIKGAQVTIRRDLTRTMQEEGLINDFGVYDRNNVIASTPYTNNVPWDTGWDPIVVDEPHVQAHSYVSIARYSKHENPTPFLVLVNAEVVIASQSEGIEIDHSFARDDDGSSSKVFTANLAMTKFDRSWGGEVSWIGLLQEAKFFDPAADNPWKHATDLSGDDDENYDANYGYPYTPPIAKINKHEYPLPVRITLHYGSPRRVERGIHHHLGLDDNED